MDLSKILSISGKSGLFKVVSQLKNATLVESLLDNKRFPAFPHEKISSLEEIAVFTQSEEKPLKDILKAIYEKQQGKPAPDPKSDEKALKNFFLEVVPDYDQERVYVSDIKKILGWYNLLLEHNLLDFTEEKKEEGGEKKEEGGEKKEEGGEKKEEGGEKKEEKVEKKEVAAEKKVRKETGEAKKTAKPKKPKEE